MKRCNVCNIQKIDEEFQKRARNKDGLANMCKSCKRAYDNSHYANNPHRRSYIRENSSKRIAKVRSEILEYLKNHPCVDCGETDPIVLEFDHRENKVSDISKLVRRGNSKTVFLEIEKCDVRCANCHRRKTAKDFGWWKHGTMESGR